jgi:hypothetical protein
MSEIPGQSGHALFAHLKRILRLERLRLRGPSGAQDEFLLAATVQNLRKLAKLSPLPAPMPALAPTNSRAPVSSYHLEPLGRRLLQHNPPKAVVRKQFGDHPLPAATVNSNLKHRLFLADCPAHPSR